MKVSLLLKGPAHGVRGNMFSLGPKQAEGLQIPRFATLMWNLGCIPCTYLQHCFFWCLREKMGQEQAMLDGFQHSVVQRPQVLCR